MAANTFVNNIPGWDEEEQFPIEDSVLHPPIASASGVNPPNQEPIPIPKNERGGCNIATKIWEGNKISETNQ